MADRDIDKDLKEEYPPNPRVRRERLVERKDEDKTERRVEKVVTGKVKTQKRSLGKKFMDTFIEDDSRNVGGYMFHDVLIPAAKSLICDVVGWGGFAEMILFKDVKSRGSSSIRRDGGRSYTSYNRASSPNRDRGRDRDRDSRDRDMSKTGRARHDFSEIILETRGEAEEVLSQLVDLTIDYGIASVSDLYELVGITSEHTDEKWGWTELRSASVSRVRDGYLINLPRTRLID